MAPRHPVGAIDVALRLIARRDFTRREMERRLAGAGYGGVEIEEALARLMSWGYLDDRATARRAVEEALARKPRGRALLCAELSARGIGDTEIAEALSSYPEAKEVVMGWEALLRLGLRSPLCTENRARAWRALARLGFSEPTIERICGLPDP